MNKKNSHTTQHTGSPDTYLIPPIATETFAELSERISDFQIMVHHTSKHRWPTRYARVFGIHGTTLDLATPNDTMAPLFNAMSSTVTRKALAIAWAMPVRLDGVQALGVYVELPGKTEVSCVATRINRRLGRFGAWKWAPLDPDAWVSLPENILPWPSSEDDAEPLL